MTAKLLPPNAQAQPPHPEIAALQQVMQAIADRLPEIGAALSSTQRPLMANALLNLSVNRILAVEGAAATASILQRLAALILGGDRPADGDGYRLNGHDA